MRQKNRLWQLADKQAGNVPRIKNRKAKDRQIVLLCKTLAEAMKGCK